jgi:hypothetical protein
MRRFYGGKDTCKFDSADTKKYGLIAPKGRCKKWPISLLDLISKSFFKKHTETTPLAAYFSIEINLESVLVVACARGITGY